MRVLLGVLAGSLLLALAPAAAQAHAPSKRAIRADAIWGAKALAQDSPLVRSLRRGKVNTYGHRKTRHSRRAFACAPVVLTSGENGRYCIKARLTHGRLKYAFEGVIGGVVMT